MKTWTTIVLAAWMWAFSILGVVQLIHYWWGLSGGVAVIAAFIIGAINGYVGLMLGMGASKS